MNSPFCFFNSQHYRKLGGHLLFQNSKGLCVFAETIHKEGVARQVHHDQAGKHLHLKNKRAANRSPPAPRNAGWLHSQFFSRAFQCRLAQHVLGYQLQLQNIMCLV